MTTRMDFVIQHSYLIPLLPLIGAAAAGVFGARHLRHNSHWPIWIGVGASAVLSFVLLFGILGRWDPHAHEDGRHAASDSRAGAAEALPEDAAEAAGLGRLYTRPTLQGGR